MRPLSVIVLAVSTLLSGCGRPAAPAAARSGAVARVGNVEILPADVVAEAERRRHAGVNLPEARQLVSEMTLEEAMVQRAVAMGIDKDPEVQRTWRSLLIGTLKSRELDPKLRTPAVSDAEIKAGYESRKESFTLPERTRVGMVFVAVPPGAPEAAVQPLRERIEAAAALARQAGGFAEAAQKYSDHQASRYRGGEVGWITRDQAPRVLPAAAVNAVLALKPGEVSEVMKERDGFYLLTAIEHVESKMRPLAEVEASLRSSLARAKQDEARAAFDEELRRGADVQVFDEVVSTLTIPASGGLPDAPPAGPQTSSN